MGILNMWHMYFGHVAHMSLTIVNAPIHTKVLRCNGALTMIKKRVLCTLLKLFWSTAMPP